MKKKKLYYDVKLLSERIEDLRKKEGNNKTTLDELVKMIKEKTGEDISKTTLSNYENTDTIGNMRISNLIAIANTYEVSMDYLLGKTKSKMYDYTSQMTSDKYALSDESMKKLSNLNNKKDISSKDNFTIKLINFIIEDDNFLNELQEKLVLFYKAKDNGINIKEEYDIPLVELTKYSIMNILERFMENSYKNLWYKKEVTLFDIPKNKKLKEN